MHVCVTFGNTVVMVDSDSSNKQHCAEWKFKRNENFLGLRTVPPLLTLGLPTMVLQKSQLPPCLAILHGSTSGEAGTLCPLAQLFCMKPVDGVGGY